MRALSPEGLGWLSEGRSAHLHAAFLGAAPGGVAGAGVRLVALGAPWAQDQGASKGAAPQYPQRVHVLPI